MSVLNSVESWVAIPHELLHVLAHRIIGQPCDYRFGQKFVRPLTPLSLRQRLFVLLFPFAVTFGAGLAVCLLALAWIFVRRFVLLADYQTVQREFVVLTIVAALCITYAGLSIYDLLAVYHLRRRPPPR